MLRAFFISGLVLLIGPSFGQMIKVKSGEFVVEEPHFNKEFIARNRIHHIEGFLSTKKEMEPIRRKSEHYHYEFDIAGEMNLQMNMLGIPGSGKDTSLVGYEYDSTGSLTAKRRNDPHGFFSYHYAYDDKGRQIESAYNRDENLGPTRYEFVQGESYSITSEKFNYKDLGNGTTEKTFFNNYGDPFKKERWTYNELGYLTEITSHFLISNRRSKVGYTYDEKGRTKERITINDLGRGDSERLVYEYDEVGQLLSKKIFRNEEQIKLIEYLYDKKTMLLDAELTKVMDNNFIRIVQYEYVFWDDRGTGVATSE